MRIEPILPRILLFVLCIALAAATQAGVSHTLQELIDQRRCDIYVPATAQQLQRAETAFENLLAAGGRLPAGVAGTWRDLGFSVTQLTDAGVTWIVLREAPGNCRGQGLYLIRQGAAAALLLQVPHGYFDRFTDDIAAGLVQGPIRMFAFNTVPRHYTRGGTKVDADFAHRADNLFTSLTRAFARVYPAGRLVQLHGFSPEKRDTAAGRSAAVIVSSGSPRPTPASLQVAQCLRALLDEPVRIYPGEVHELGAITNRQGKLLRQQGHAGFVHVELSSMLRERLRSEAGLRAGFGACLYSGMDKE